MWARHLEQPRELRRPPARSPALAAPEGASLGAPPGAVPGPAQAKHSAPGEGDTAGCRTAVPLDTVRAAGV